MSYASIKTVIVVVALIVSGAIFAWRAYQLLWVNLRRGQPSPGILGNWSARVKSVVVYVGAQLRLFRFLVPGTAHFFIFWGFVLLSLTIMQAMGEGLFAFAIPNFRLPIIGDWGLLALIQDFFALAVIIAVSYALYLRIVANPERYKGSHRRQGVMVLAFIMTIMLSLLVLNGVSINLGADALARWRPISFIVGRVFAGLNEGTQEVVGEIAYWIHLGTVLLFLTELPEGKHFHIVTSIPAVFLRNLDPVGRLPAAAEFDGKPGVSAIDQFRWRTMLDFYTCTECGRCQQVCPAYNSGLPLTPKLLVMNLREHLVEHGAALRASQRAQSRGEHSAAPAKSLVPDVIAEQTLWACSTCGACDQECPLFIQHVTPIVDIRRYLLSDGRADERLQEMLAKMSRYGNSFGKSERMRSQWAQKLDPKVRDARKEAVEYLWFVGDYASYSAGLTDVTRKTADVFQKAHLDFGILYDAEQNAGNDVRRIGEEGLYEMLVQKNVAAMGKASFRKIVTTDPHTYNTLKNEYPANGNGSGGSSQQHPVIHYAELLDEMIRGGQLKLKRKLNYTVTYHDPCYLGRYNGIYDAPRRVIQATGCQLVEMPRHGDRSFCCGAGGGRIWMEEDALKERPSESRVREAAALDGVTALVVTCPKDMTMYRDAVKTTGQDNRLVVKDLIELVHEAM